MTALPAPDWTPPRVMDTRDAARYLGVAPHTVTRMIRRGELPALKVGRGYRLSLEALDSRLRGDA